MATAFFLATVRDLVPKLAQEYPGQEASLVQAAQSLAKFAGPEDFSRKVATLFGSNENI